MKGRLLIVEDDADFGFMLKQYLEHSDFEIGLIEDSRVIQKDLAIVKDYDLVILDVMMPYVSGFMLAKEIHSFNPELPIIFLTAKDQKIDKLTGLKIGADDYLTKPCDPEELILRVQNIIRRTKGNRSSSEVIQIGQYKYFINEMMLVHQEVSQQLTEREAKLLSFLLDHRGKIISREEILNTIWSNNDFFAGRSMDVFISRLRKYFYLDPTLSIQSIRSIGFKIDL